MTELDEDGMRWTDEARESFRAAAANLVEAIHRHSRALLELTGTDADHETIAEADERIEQAAVAYADAQFELSGTVPPLGLDEEDDYELVEDLDDELDDELDEDLEDTDLEDDLDDDDVEDDDFEDTGTRPGSERTGPADTGEPSHRLTLLHRADFLVTDEQAVIQAGKEAYHDAWDPAGHPQDVTDLGAALQQLRQAGGIDVLAEAPGMVPAGATTWILEAAELLDEHDPDDWPDSPFAPGEDAARRLLLRVDETAG